MTKPKKVKTTMELIKLHQQLNEAKNRKEKVLDQIEKDNLIELVIKLENDLKDALKTTDQRIIKEYEDWKDGKITPEPANEQKKKKDKPKAKKRKAKALIDEQEFYEAWLLDIGFETRDQIVGENYEAGTMLWKKASNDSAESLSITDVFKDIVYQVIKTKEKKRRSKIQAIKNHLINRQIELQKLEQLLKITVSSKKYVKFNESAFLLWFLDYEIKEEKAFRINKKSMEIEEYKKKIVKVFSLPNQMTEAESEAAALWIKHQLLLVKILLLGLPKLKKILKGVQKSDVMEEFKEIKASMWK